MMETWQLQEAKNKFSAVVERAMAGKPQLVTRHGKPVAVITSVEDYQASHPDANAPQMNLVEFLMSAPKLPDEWFENGNDPFPRIKGGTMRDIDWGDDQ